MTRRHWAESSIVYKLRTWFGITKPIALQWGEWDEWKKTTKREHPIGWWFTEVLPDALEWFPKTFLDPFYLIGYYYRNRFHRQTHVLRTGFKPGKYHDLSERLLYGVMESLVDFIEVEKAWLYIIWHPEDNLKLVKGRNAAAGLKYIDWEITLDSDDLPDDQRSDLQAAAAREMKTIYHWWKEVRPHRPDPMDTSGWLEYCDEIRDTGWELLDERRPKEPGEDERTRTMHRSMHEMEEAYDREDEEMLCRVMKIRLHLWT